MTSIDHFMAWLERHLQELVEGGTSWLLPGGRRRRELARWMAEVMSENARPGRDGSMQAPDLFILTLPGTAAAKVNDALLVELAAGLKIEARQRGLVLQNDPVVRVVFDPQGTAARVQISYSQDESSDTATLKVEPEAPTSGDPSTLGRAYLVVEGRDIFMLGSPVVSIGRDPGNALVLTDMRVSRAHAQLRLVQGQYVIFDLQSTGGTAVNGRAVRRQALAPGDVITLAGVPLVYGQEISSERDATQKLPVEPDGGEMV